VSFKSCSFVLEIDRTIRRPRPLAEATPALFESLLDTFAPFEIAYRVDGGHQVDIERAMVGGLWPGEQQQGGDVLTRCTPAKEIVGELRDRLAGTSPQQIWASAEVALFHHAAQASRPAWHGRWRTSPTTYRELASVRFYWTDLDLREVEIAFPLSGYPLTSTRLTGSASIEEGDGATAVVNRELILPALARVRGALGLTAAQARWSTHGEYGFHYPDDEADIQQKWLPLLDA
jgi:hypothetical protein